MECLGPQCASMLLEWLRARAGESTTEAPSTSSSTAPRQGWLWTSAPYNEEAPSSPPAAELAGAIEHLQYAVFRRFQNQLTRAERTRLDNSIENCLFKINRYLERTDPSQTGQSAAEVAALRQAIREGREKTERLRSPGAPRRAEACSAHLVVPGNVRGVRRRALRSPWL